jgi:hypothetical protein
MTMRLLAHLLAGMLFALWLGGCANSARTAPRPSFVDWWPDASRWKKAVGQTAIHPSTWGPLAGAVLIQAANWDEKISEWAIENTPVFGSNDAASQASDTLVTGCQIVMAGSALAVPGDGSPWKSRAARLAAGYGSMLISDTITGAGKEYFKRQRPLGSGRDGFPSRHSTLAFSYATSAVYNLGQIQISAPWRRAGQWGVTMTAVAGGWARVEAGHHYPTDVLVGAVIGSFVSSVIHQAFFNSDSNIQMTATTDARQGFYLKMQIAF